MTCNRMGWQGRVRAQRIWMLFALSCSINIAISASQLQNDASNISPAQKSPFDTISVRANDYPYPPTASTIPHVPLYYSKVRAAHAILAAAAWLIFFPAGAILIRVLSSNGKWYDTRVHYLTQTFGIIVFAVSAGMGIWMAKTIHVLNQYHPIIGLALLGVLAIQPLTQLINHYFYRRNPRVILVVHVHIWLGRLLIAIGIIQGGLGFVFSNSVAASITSMPTGITLDPNGDGDEYIYTYGNPALSDKPSTKSARIVYGVIATIVWILYISLGIVWPEVRHTFGWWQRREERSAAKMRAKRDGENGRELRNYSLSDGVALAAVDPEARESY